VSHLRTSKQRAEKHLAFVVGAPKTATTALCGVLNCHPDVFMMCEVELANRHITRWGKRLLREHPHMEPFFCCEGADILEAYGRAQAHLSKLGYARQLFGDKFVGIESNIASKVDGAKIIFTVRHLPEWLAKDSVLSEYKFEDNIVPIAVQYSKQFLESFRLERVFHVRFSDFLRHHRRTVDSIWHFLDIESPQGGDRWWESVGNYPPGDPKQAISWWRGHASSAVQPQSSDTQVEIANLPFWQEILPIFNRYYKAAGAAVRPPLDEIEADLQALDLIAEKFAVPTKAAYLHSYSRSANFQMKTERRKRQARSWKSAIARFLK
jgi:hypothetical protein